MNKYQNGKIYKIQPNIEHEEGEVYIGSTINSLSYRFSKHKSDYKKQDVFYTSFKIFDKYGIENCNIFLIENYPSDTKKQLRTREDYYIKINQCVNQISAVLDIEKRITNKKIYAKNYDKDIRNKNKYECVCGCNVIKRNKTQHERTPKHIRYMEQ